MKEPYIARVRFFVGRLSRALFLTRDSSASLPDGSGCWIRMIRMSVLRQLTSHLLLIRTNSGYGTVLTAACTRPGCSDSHCIIIIIILLLLLFTILWVVYVFRPPDLLHTRRLYQVTWQERLKQLHNKQTNKILCAWCPDSWSISLPTTV
jgi:hypothetical protein